jgi:hypothetical protein
MPRFTINIITGYNTLRKVGEAHVQVRVKIRELFVTEQAELQQFYLCLVYISRPKALIHTNIIWDCFVFLAHN